MDTMEQMAEEYPDVVFSHGTGYKSNGKKTSTTTSAEFTRQDTFRVLRQVLKQNRTKSVM
ncbi:MAG: hypothetical protein L6V93_11225 [Clostridiales bacterium]|nr:MAG: hypothetical protein L6V93_11225 [Clostridiales bacterium]